jgi:hypothetical protein
MLRQMIAFAALPLLASCVAPRETAVPMPAPAPAPRPAPVPAPIAVVDRYAGDWSVADLGPGDWSYSRSDTASAARFGSGEGATAMLRCEGGQIVIAREGVVPADMAAALNIRTSFAERQLPIRVLPSTGRMLAAILSPSDPLWDQILYSRGRFVIEATRNAPMIVPTRPELARVVEDCRN